MKNNIRQLAFCGSILAVAGLTTSVQAGITEADNLGFSWIGTPTYVPAAGAVPSSFATAENNYGSTGGAGGNGALSQSFTLSSAGTLSTIQLVMSGAASTFDVELYDLGAYPGSGYPATSASYTPGSLTSLLQAGDSFSYSGVAAGANVVQLTFTGADASLTLNAGELYAFQIDPTSSAGTVWFRGNLGGPGQEYRMNQFTASNMGALNGATRDASFALTLAPAPEPTTLALAGLGGLASLVALRRNK
jgi:hypothetical protein